MPKQIYCLVLFFLFCDLSVSAQQAIEWQKTPGGTGSEELNQIHRTTDGGYIGVGRTDSNDGDISGNHGGDDVWVIKLDSSGNLQWQRSLGSTGSDQGYAIRQTPDGGYILTGFSSANDGDVTGNHGGADFWVVKLDSSGNIQWQKSLGGTGSDFGFDIRLVTGGGYIVAGQCNSIDGDVTGNHGDWDYWVVKLDNAGNIVWQNSYGGSDTDHAYRLLETAEGGYIVAGRSSSHNGDVTGNHDAADFWIVKLSVAGALEWQNSYGGSGVDIGRCIEQTPDKGYIITGWTNSTDGDLTLNQGLFDYWVLKIDSVGALQWQRTYGGSGTEWPYYISRTSEGGYIVAGYTTSLNGDVTVNYGGTDFWIVKLDNTGNIEWQKTYGGTSEEQSRCIEEIAPEKYIVAGFTESNDIDVSGFHGYRDCWVVKLSGHVGITELPKNGASVSIYPNPAENKISLNVGSDLAASAYTITDVTGRTLLFGETAGEETIIDISSLHSGPYIISIRGSMVKSLLFVKY